MTPDLKHILYAEDEPDIRTVATMALRMVAGLEVTACEDGVEAVQRAPGAGADLLLLDVMMPGLDGPSTLAALRAHEATAATPVIFMTAKVQAREIAQYRALGAIGVISKPFDPMTLAEEVRRIWSEAQPG